jgi:hypothetical protein|mmetsp:Transcript_13341/g.21073  ORF Transcript_13341/g.21073 Transcript_13341/m.21073 type:complete len:140 (-) Transcript_13341:454-873(-)
MSTIPSLPELQEVADKGASLARMRPKGSQAFHVGQSSYWSGKVDIAVCMPEAGYPYDCQHPIFTWLKMCHAQSLWHHYSKAIENSWSVIQQKDLKQMYGKRNSSSLKRDVAIKQYGLHHTDRQCLGRCCRQFDSTKMDG